MNKSSSPTSDDQVSEFALGVINNESRDIPIFLSRVEGVPGDCELEGLGSSFYAPK